MYRAKDNAKNNAQCDRDDDAAVTFLAANVKVERKGGVESRSLIFILIV